MMRLGAFGLQIGLSLGLMLGCTRVVVSGAATSGASSTVAGSTSAGSAGGASSGGSTTGASSSPTSSAGGSTGSSSGSSTGAEGVTGTPPYQGYDSGPRDEPPIAPGCSAEAPLPGCVTCLADSDCPPGLYCAGGAGDPPYECYPCRLDADAGTFGCPPGRICYGASQFFAACLPDCRLPGNGCQPGSYCYSDDGLCVGGCLGDGDCRDAGGLCFSPGESNSSCVGCIPGDAGCPPGELCNSSWQCQPNCVDAGTKCPTDSICEPTTGDCIPGCNSDSDCGGATPFCDTALSLPVCSECRQVSDCPPSNPGCAQPFGCPTCGLTCGQCQGDIDCPSGLHCSEGICACAKSSDCNALPATPVCIGLDAGPGSCACRTSADCGAGLVCEARSPFDVYTNGGRGFFVAGGVCVPSCSGADPTLCAGTFGAVAPVCNPATGYCVPCLQDGDCFSQASQPLQTPSCIPFPDGELVPVFYPFGPIEPTGGGQCGCRSTAACDDGLTCKDPGGPGQCVPPCTFVDGLDSCDPAFGLGFCNTFTGLCQGCLDDYDCTNRTDPVLGMFPAPICSPAGACAQCTDSSQCPADLPGCTFGACGYCGTSADCPAGQGFVCARFYDAEYRAQCLLPCVQGDDAGLESVSDAGPSCPAALPFCVKGFGDAGTFCGECRSLKDDCGANVCCETFCSPRDFCGQD